MNLSEHHREQLSDGIANVVRESDKDRPVARIVPIEIGERVGGHRPEGADDEPSIWDEEPLREAFEQSALRDPIHDRETRIVLGESGVNPHFDFEEQAAPQNVVGQVDRWEWEEGVGPVAYAQLADDGIAERIDMGLLEVSADWLRLLGEYDSERGGKPVDEVIGLPRITILENGASGGASVEITESMAEALAYNPDSDDTLDDLKEQHASDGDAVRWESDGGGSREPDDERYGVVVNPAPDDSEMDWMVSVYQAQEDYDGWEARNETNAMADDTLERVGGDGVGSLPPVSQVMDAPSEQNAAGRSGTIGALIDRAARLIERAEQLAANGTGPDPSVEADDDFTDQFAEDSTEFDELAESSCGEDSAGTTDTGADTDNTHMSPDPDLQEQLSKAQTRVDKLEDKKEQLADEKESLEDDLSETETEVDDLEEQLSDKEDTIDELEEQVDSLKPVKEVLAEIVAADSLMDAESVAEQHSATSLLDMISENADTDEDKSPRELVEEQLTQTLDPDGSSEGGTNEDELTEEQLAEANDIALSAMGSDEIRAASQEGKTYREFAQEQMGADPVEFDSPEAFREAVKASGGDA